MSGLVFVQDAQARPLMPTSTAYARTLSRQRKARLEPHPTFPLIRLTRSVATPVVRPVLLAIVLHHTTAELLLLIDNARAAPTSLSILVELSPLAKRSNRLCHASNGLASRRRQPYIPYVALGIPASLRMVIGHRQARAIISTIILLQSLLPLSHVTILSAQLTPATLSDHRNWTKQILVDTFTTSTNGLTFIEPMQHSTTTLPPTLIRMLSTIAARHTRPVPEIVALFPAHRRHIIHENFHHEQQLSNKQPKHKKTDDNTLSNVIVHGRLCTIHLKGRSVTGVVCGRDNNQLILRVLHRADPRSIHWQLIRVRPHVPRRLWPPDAVLLLPNIVG